MCFAFCGQMVTLVDTGFITAPPNRHVEEPWGTAECLWNRSGLSAGNTAQGHKNSQVRNGEGHVLYTIIIMVWI